MTNKQLSETITKLVNALESANQSLFWYMNKYKDSMNTNIDCMEEIELALSAVKSIPKDNDLWYLQDTRSYVGNSVSWWAKDGNGYTTDASKAHI